MKKNSVPKANVRLSKILIPIKHRAAQQISSKETTDRYSSMHSPEITIDLAPKNQNRFREPQRKVTFKDIKFTRSLEKGRSEKIYDLPPFSNLILKSNMETNNEKIPTESKGINTDMSEEIMPKETTKQVNLPVIQYDLNLPPIIKQTPQEKKEMKMKSDYLSANKKKQLYSRKINNFPSFNEFQVDERSFEIERFNKVLNKELEKNINVNLSKNRKKRCFSVSEMSINGNEDFDKYQMLKMAEKRTKRLLPINLNKDRSGIELLSRKIFENVRGEPELY